MKASLDPDESRQPLFLDAVLHPYRSLPPRGFVAIMAVLTAASVIAGTICILAGAWPVFGFLGLDVALVYLAFRVSYRSARQRDHVRLSARSLDVERISVRGERRQFQFEPAWLRVVHDDTEECSAVTLSSHGRKVAVGSFLAPAERQRFAAALREALARWRDATRGR